MRIKRHPVDAIALARHFEPTDELSAFAGLRRCDHGLVAQRKRRRELLGKWDRDGVDPEPAIERLDDTPRCVRRTHAEKQQTAG